MGFLVDVAVGSAVVVLPKHNFALLALAGTVQGIKALRDHKKRREAELELHSALPAAALAFTSVTCSIDIKAKGGGAASTKTILEHVSGSAQPGRLLALMGPSGSGKTSLLNALSDHVAVTKGMHLSGSVTVNGRSLADSGVRTGYVEQEDMFYSQMSVRETLDMAAALRLPRSSTPEQRGQVVDAIVQKLGLRKVEGTVVGDRKTRGISGGEKKRLSIACELISRPSLLFLDEPTTGLDAFQAELVMQTLKQLANDGHTIVVSIHQPRSSIYAMFDDLLLLSAGRVVYAGPVHEALSHMEAAGHACPPNYNPAEFLADLISVDRSSPEAEASTEATVDHLVSIAPSARPPATDGASMTSVAPAQPPKAPLSRQLPLLLKRSWKQATGDKAALRLRVLTNIQSGVVFGGIWWRLRNLQKSVGSRIGLLQVVAVYMSQSALFKTLNVFPAEKTLVSAERQRGSYDVLPYFVSKLIAELPLAALYPAVFSSIVYPMTGLQATPRKFAAFVGSNVLETCSSTAMGLAVGAVAPSTEAALVIGPAVMLVFIVFGGLYTQQDDVPAAFRWIPNTSQIKRGYDTLVINELTGLEITDGGPGSAHTGSEVLVRNGFKGTVAESLVGQGRILLFYWWLTYCILRAQKPRMQAMEPAAVTDA